MIKTSVGFPSCFGLTNPKDGGSPYLELDGNFDRKTQQVTFSARANEALPILPEEVANDPALPIEQVLIRGAVISLVRGKPRISLDGSIMIRPFKIGDIPDMSTDPGSEIVFHGLGISLPLNMTTASAISLAIDYPSLQLNIDGPKFSLGPLQLNFSSIGIDFHDLFAWDSLLNLTSGSITGKHTLLLGLHIELMKLPAIADQTLDRLTFNLQLGLPLLTGGASWDIGSARVSISALGFDKLDLDLFRFIEIGTKKVTFAHTTTPPATATLTLDTVSVKVLDRQVLAIDQAMFFARAGETGFYLAFLPASVPADSVFTLDWAIIGHNVTLGADAVMRMLEIAPTDGTADETPPTIIGDPIPAAPGTGSNWMIGAAISALYGMFEGRFIYDETGTIGLALKAGFLQEWFGLDLAIAVLYSRGKRPDEDEFAVSLTIPQFAVGDFNFDGGVVAFDFQVDGGFLLDLGYPWPTGATRQWYRALGAIITPFQGSGGLYIERRNLYQDGGGLTHLAGGYAAQAGLGAAFGGGVFTAWVAIGIYVSLDGDLYLKGTSVVGVRITGAVGVLFQGHAELNFWIISISVDVSVSAEASATISWQAGGLNPPIPGITPGPATLRIDFTVYASASASACIRLGFVHLCRGISVTIPMRAAYTLTL